MNYLIWGFTIIALGFIWVDAVKTRYPNGIKKSDIFPEEKL